LFVLTLNCVVNSFCCLFFFPLQVNKIQHTLNLLVEENISRKKKKKKRSRNASEVNATGLDYGLNRIGMGAKGPKGPGRPPGTGAKAVAIPTTPGMSGLASKRGKGPGRRGGGAAGAGRGRGGAASALPGSGGVPGGAPGVGAAAGANAQATPAAANANPAFSGGGSQFGGDSEEEDVAKPMSYDEKRQLSLDINKLPGPWSTFLVILCENTRPPDANSERKSVWVVFKPKWRIRRDIRLTLSLETVLTDVKFGFENSGISIRV
jgi:hypothetical protein